MKLLTIAILIFTIAVNAHGKDLFIDTVTMETHSRVGLGNASANNNNGNIFLLEKTLLKKILSQLNINYESLSPALKAKLAKQQTMNFKAFLSFAEGLDYFDNEQFDKARNSFENAALLDPGFYLAGQYADAMPETYFTIKEIVRFSINNAMTNTGVMLTKNNYTPPIPVSGKIVIKEGDDNLTKQSNDDKFITSTMVITKRKEPELKLDPAPELAPELEPENLIENSKELRAHLEEELSSMQRKIIHKNKEVMEEAVKENIKYNIKVDIIF
jgi:hypothetical protein